jgi:protein transport protein SEC24
VNSKEYTSKKTLEPLNFIFVIEVTENSTDLGVTDSIISSLKAIIKEYQNSKIKIGFITYGDTVQLYNLKDGHPQANIMSDIDDPFAPLPPSKILFNISQLTSNITLFEKFIQLTNSSIGKKNCLGSAIKVAKDILEETGGKIICFTTDTPNIGIGKFEPRNMTKLYGTESERELYGPQDGFWKKFADECGKNSISVDMFFFPQNYIEIATIGYICNKTSGQMYIYPSFNPKNDIQKLFYDLKRNLKRNYGTDAIIKVRCSTGLSASKYLGNFYQQTKDSVELPAIDSDFSFAITFKHDFDLEKGSKAYFQVAVLYTSKSGIRFIRLHTLRLPTTDNIANLFKNSDMDALLSIITRFSVNQVIRIRDSMDLVREYITETSISILTSYRTECSKSSNSQQLVLPETLKLLPVYFLGLIKSPSFSTGK